MAGKKTQHSGVKWIGKGVAKHRRQPNKLYYDAFDHQGLRISVGDHVLVANDNHPDDDDFTFVVEVMELYDTGDPDDEDQLMAAVKWYWRRFEISKSESVDFMEYENEIFVNTNQNVEPAVPVESIVGRCEVIEYEYPDEPDGDVPMFSDEGLPFFVAMRSYSGHDVKRIGCDAENKENVTLNTTPGTTQTRSASKSKRQSTGKADGSSKKVREPEQRSSRHRSSIGILDESVMRESRRTKTPTQSKTPTRSKTPTQLKTPTQTESRTPRDRSTRRETLDQSESRTPRDRSTRRETLDQSETLTPRDRSTRRETLDQSESRTPRDRSRKETVDQSESRTPRDRSRRETLNQSESRTPRDRSTRRETLDQSETRAPRDRSTRRETLDQSETRTPRDRSRGRTLDQSEPRSARDRSRNSTPSAIEERGTRGRSRNNTPNQFEERGARDQSRNNTPNQIEERSTRGRSRNNTPNQPAETKTRAKTPQQSETKSSEKSRGRPKSSESTKSSEKSKRLSESQAESGDTSRSRRKSTRSENQSNDKSTRTRKSVDQPAFKRKASVPDRRKSMPATGDYDVIDGIKAAKSRRSEIKDRTPLTSNNVTSEASSPMWNLARYNDEDVLDILTGSDEEEEEETKIKTRARVPSLILSKKSSASKPDDGSNNWKVRRRHSSNNICLLAAEIAPETKPDKKSRRKSSIPIDTKSDKKSNDTKSDSRKRRASANFEETAPVPKMTTRVRPIEQAKRTLDFSSDRKSPWKITPSSEKVSRGILDLKTVDRVEPKRLMELKHDASPVKRPVRLSRSSLSPAVSPMKNLIPPSPTKSPHKSHTKSPHKSPHKPNVKSPLKSKPKYRQDSDEEEKEDDECSSNDSRRRSTRKSRARFSMLELDSELTDPLYSPATSESSKSSETPKRKSSSRTPKGSKKGSAIKRTPRTPRSQTWTPSMPARSKPCPVTDNLLEEARARLHVSVVPDQLPCRTKEYDDVYQFVESRIINGTGGCMYISGVPGTGKTATVHEVIRTLYQESMDEVIPSFKYVEINGMKMTDPHQAHVQIYKMLTGEKVTANHAVQLLEKRFSSKGVKRETTVLVVDELDLLWNRKQNVLYNIFDWPMRPQAKLIVLAIANTMDLPERIMKNRVASRLGSTRIVFQPYTHKQLIQIVKSRIEELGVFDVDAVQFVSRKVAAVSGDARRALDICRRATELAEHCPALLSPSKSRKCLVGMNHVDTALQEMFSSPIVQAIKNLSVHETLFIRALLAEFERSGLEEATLERVHTQHTTLARFEGVPELSGSDLAAVCARLGGFRLCLVEHSRNDLKQRIRLNVSTDDVSYALREAKL